MDRLIVRYHGTKFKYDANKILESGFNEGTFFSKDLADAIEFGGKYVFEVIFKRKEIPINWQIRCLNRIPANRIMGLTLYKMDKIRKYKNLGKKVFKSNIEYSHQQPDYCFEEKDPDFLNK